MKKLSILFVVLAVVSLTCVAFAQENDFSEYLGVWYADTSCFSGECIPSFITGSQGELEIKADFSVTIIYRGRTSGLFGKVDDSIMTGQWYTEGDIIYSKLSWIDDPIGEEVVIKFDVNEDGNLIVLFGDDDFDIYTRDFRAEWGKGLVKENAELEDFLGEWGVYATGNPKWVEGIYIFTPETWQYVDRGRGTLNVDKDNIDINVEAITLRYINSYEQIENSVLNFSDVPFEIKNGKLVGAFTDKNGRQPFEIEYHTENALVMTVNPGKENESIHIFITEEDVKNDLDKYMELINSL